MTEKEITKMLRKAEFNTEFDDYVIENRHRFEHFAKLVADKKVEGMVMMTHDEFKSVWDKAQAEEREALASEAEKNGNTILAMQIRARGQQ